jgi:hypothetical protein
VAGRVEASLAENVCGPTHHQWGPGPQISEAYAVGHEEPVLNRLALCSVCGRLEHRDYQCVFCDEPGLFVRGFVMAPDGTGVEGMLCAECYLELQPSSATGYSFMPG